VSQRHLWWQSGVIYEVYVRSFMDSNGDGIGDLPGIRQRLEYLKWLGIDAVWISPIFPSPMADFGYDVADYTAIHPLFGSMADFDALLASAHELGLKVLLDLVPNHTSENHPWFVESRSSRTNSKRDWYLWRDPAPDGGPPNNWLSVFGGSGWEFDRETGQYYYHAFLKEQPDLNWRNPAVEEALFDIMRFWLDKGVDGFRVDVMWHILKDAEFRDNPPNPWYRPGEENPFQALIPAYSTDQPDVHGIVRRMRRLTDQYSERVIIAEIYLPVNELIRYYGEHGSGAHLPFNFQLILLPWRALDIYAAVTEYEASLPSYGWPNWVLGNHDQTRIATRVKVPAQARVAAVLLLTLRGTPTLYYGDEIGMEDVPIPRERYQDPQGINIGISRDPERTPMQWNAGRGAGFTTGVAWLPISDDVDRVNVEVQRDDPSSMLSLHRRLLSMRASEPAFSIGNFTPAGIDGDVMAFVREAEGSAYLVILNLGPAASSFAPEGVVLKGTVVLSTLGAEREGAVVDGDMRLLGDEAVIIALLPA
jgi:alpha-glucosidase